MTELETSLLDNSYLSSIELTDTADINEKIHTDPGFSEVRVQVVTKEDETSESTSRSETITMTSGLETISSSIEKSTNDSSEDKGMETDNDVEENLPDDGDETIDENIDSKKENSKECDKKDSTINAEEKTDDIADKMDNKLEEETDKIQDDVEKENEQKVSASKNRQGTKNNNLKNEAEDESLDGKSDKDTLNKSGETTDSQEGEARDEMDTSTGEKEFTQFLSQTPHEIEQVLEDTENGIVINDKDIIRAEDVFGRGKRSRTPKTDSIYTSEFDPDYDPKEENRARRFIKQAKQITDSPKESTPLKKSKFPNLDINALEKPAETGWRREIVVRNTFDECKKRPADVYYKPPTGKKLRSMVEVSSYLRQHKIKDLTENNFSFIKTPISNPPFETVRNAGKALGFAKKKPEIVIEKDSDEPAVPFNGTSEAGTQSLLTKSPRGRKRKHSGTRGRPSKYSLLVDQLKKKPVDTKEIESEDSPVAEMQLHIKTEPVDPDDHQENEEEKEATFPECPPTLEETRRSRSPTMSPPKKKPKATARKSTTQKSFKPTVTSPDGANNKLEPLCSLSCPGLFGQPPSLQCNVCLCMFHPKCVNLNNNAQSFICLRCINKACSPGQEGLMNVPSPTLLNSVISPSTTSSVVFTTTKSHLVPLTSFLSNALSTTTKSSVTVATVAPSNSISTNSVAGVKIKKEPVDYDENQSAGRGASNNVIGNVRNFLERKATDMNQNQSVGQYPLLKEGLQRPSQIPTNTTSNIMFLPTGTFGGSTMLPVASTTLLTNLPLGSIPAPMVYNSIPGAAVRPVVAFPGVKTQTDFNTPQMPISSPVSLHPPRLVAAPGTKSKAVPANTGIHEINGFKPDDSNANKQGQLLTLPPVVIKRLNLSQPVSLKINNTQVTVPPSSFLHTAQGLKLFLPKNTFPVNTGETAKLSVTVTNDKTLSLNSESSTNNSDFLSGQLPTIVPNSSRTVTETPTENNKMTTRQFKSGINPASCFIKSLYGGFDCILLIFEYLNVKDLFRVASVCRTWRKLALHQCLWREVRFQNMKITDWEKAAKYLCRRAVEVLNLRGLKHPEDRSRSWHQLISVVHQFTCVHTINFGLVPGSVLEALCEKVTRLEVLSAQWISDFTSEQMKTTPTKIDIGKFSSLTNLKTLKLRGVAGLTLPAFPLSGGISELKALKKIQTLSLTTLKEIGDAELEFLTMLPNLTHLELGDCASWNLQTYSVIGKLIQLKSLRLECGGNSYENGLTEALVNLKQLENLELIEFLIPDDLYKTLEKMDKLKSFKVWPDTSCQPAAQVNSFTLNTVTKLTALQELQWGILSNQYSSIILDGDDSNKQTKNNQEWIPFLPASDNGYDSLSESLTEYISLGNFKEKLSKLLPKTKLDVFSAKSVTTEEIES